MRATSQHSTPQILAVGVCVGLILGPIAAQPTTPQSNPARQSTTNSIGMKQALIPAGEFMMGSTPQEIDLLLTQMKERGVDRWYLASPPSEGPRHRVKITRPFYIDVYEVTVGQFRKFVEATSYRTDAEKDGAGGYGRTGGKWQQKPEYSWKNIGFEQSDDQAVVNVTWNDAVAFCRWLSRKEGKPYRLPTEAEWEYACRAGSTGRYPWGEDAAEMDQYVWHGANSGGAPHVVGQLKPNAFGLYDMCGNAYEYCQDFYSTEPYSQPSVADPQGPSVGTARVVRGGSSGTLAIHCRSAFRGDAGQTHRNQRDGFRVVSSP